MTYRRNKQKNMLAICMTYSKYGLKQCTNHLIQEKAIERYVFDDLRKIAKKTLKKDFCEQFKDLDFVKTDNTEKDRIINRLTEIKGIIKNLYEDKLKGIIDEDLFVEMARKFDGEKTRLSERLAEIDIQETKPSKRDYQDIIRKVANFEVIDRNILAKLIKRIEISRDKQIFISYNFRNPVKTA